MPLPSAISDLSQTAASNSPAGSESPNTADDYLRTYASYIAKLRDGSGYTQEATVASAATADIGAATSMFVQITGTTTITSFGTNYVGARFIRFAGALTLTYNATTLILPGAANIATAAGDTCIVVPNGNAASGWRVIAYQRGDGTDLVTPQAPFRNRAINGNMFEDQRNSGAAQTITAAAALAYCVDRFYAYCTGANVTGQQITASDGTKRYRFTGAASVTAIGFGHRIEAANSVDLAGSTCTLSVKLSNSLLTTVNWAAYYANSADSFGTLASPTRTSIASGSFTVSSTEAVYSAQVAVPAAATTGIEIVLTVGAQTSGTWTIGDVQFEKGAIPASAISFERVDVAMNKARAQRYYVRFSAGAVNNERLTGSGVVISATQAQAYFKYPVPMRALPSCTMANVTNASVWAAGALTAVTSSAADAIGSDGVNWGFTTSGGLTNGQACQLVRPAAATPSPYLECSSEL